VLCIDRANRGRVFLQQRRTPPIAAPAAAIEEDALVLRLDPELAAERVG
jgi:hypothetical protein